MKRALKEKGIDQLLDDARESNRENDLEHLKRACESFSLILLSWRSFLGRAD